MDVRSKAIKTFIRLSVWFSIIERGLKGLVEVKLNLLIFSAVQFHYAVVDFVCIIAVLGVVRECIDSLSAIFDDETKSLRVKTFETFWVIRVVNLHK